MTIHHRFRNIPKYLAWGSIALGSSSIVAYQVHQTHKRLSSIIKTGALDTEKSVPQYIYVEDPSYEMKIKEQKENETQLFGSIRQWWKKIKHSVALRLLNIARNGNSSEQAKAIEWLAKIQHLKDWDYLTLAQLLDAKTAIGLARTPGVDLRFFLPPPKYLRSISLNPESIDSSPLAFLLRDLLKVLIKAMPHSCIKYFLSKHFASFQDLTQFDHQFDATSTGIDSTDKSLTLHCLNAILHHLSATSGEFTIEKYPHSDPDQIPINVSGDMIQKRRTFLINEKDKILPSVQLAAKHGLLFLISKAIYRYPDDKEYQIVCAKLMSRLSMHNELMEVFFRNGLIGCLAKWLRSTDLRLSALAAQSLANLDQYHYEKYGFYHPNIYLLHPMYRSQKHFSCDVVFTHGLLGGVFVTWRQRDRQGDSVLGVLGKNSKSANISANGRDQGSKKIDESISSCSDEYDGCSKKSDKKVVTDPNIKELIEDMNDLAQADWESIGSDFEVIMHDIPDNAIREPLHKYICDRNENVCIDELEDRSAYTACWPKDWLPKDINNIRVLGVSYETALSEWTANCPLEAGQGAVDGTLSARARLLGWALRGAGVGDSRVIVWISHSMGGLIVKQILTEADAIESKGGWGTMGLSHWTRALAFYSTPHRGSSLAAAAAESLAVSAVLWPSRDVRELKENSKPLLKLHENWVDVVKRRGWEVVGFAEARPMLVSAWRFPLTLVGAESSDAGIGAHYAMPLDHLSICKPATRHSFLYRKVVELVCHASEVRCSNSVCGGCIDHFDHRKSSSKYQDSDTSESNETPQDVFTIPESHLSDKVKTEKSQFAPGLIVEKSLDLTPHTDPIPEGEIPEASDLNVKVDITGTDDLQISLKNPYLEGEASNKTNNIPTTDIKNFSKESTNNFFYKIYHSLRRFFTSGRSADD